LKAGNSAGEDSSIAPYLAVRGDQAMLRHSINHRDDLLDGISSVGVSRIQ